MRRDLFASLKNKAAINDRMRMTIIQKCLNQPDMHIRVLNSWPPLDKGNPQKSFNGLFNRIEDSMGKDRVEAVKNKHVEGTIARGTGAGHCADAAPCPCS